MSESSKLNEITDPNGADAPEPLMKIVLYVRKSKLPDDLRKIISDPIDKDEYGKILEALSKVSFEDGTETRKSLFIKPSGYPHKIRIRRKDAVWVDRKKGKLSRSTLLHRVIEEYKKSVEVKVQAELMPGITPGALRS